MPEITRTNRQRLADALAGREISRPAYAVYDWFVQNRPAVDWESLFEQGLGIIAHANLVRHELPHVQIEETTRPENGMTRRDVRWITDAGELHEYYLDEWRQEHLIKTPEDYRIMLRALDGVRITADRAAYDQAQAWVGENGITVGQVRGIGMGRTPLMVLQIDWVGLERCSMDLADELPEMMALLERMAELKVEEIRQAVTTPPEQIKLWENMSIETLGPVHYRRHLVSLYEKLFPILASAGKKLQCHYDGQLRIIAEDIAEMDLDGIDSFTEPPEGDMTIAEARQAWPGKFLWMHPNLHWYRQSGEDLAANVRRAVAQAGPSRYCLMISEDVPPDWQRSVPCILRTLAELPG